MPLGCSKDEHFSCFPIPCQTGLNKLSDVDKTYINIGNGQKFELYVCIMSCMNEHYPTLSTHETLQQMPSIKKNEWQRRRFFTFCSLIDVFWPLPHTVEKKCVCLLFSLILYHHSVTMFKYWQILPQKSSSPKNTKSISSAILWIKSCT